MQVIHITQAHTPGRPLSMTPSSTSRSPRPSGSADLGFTTYNLHEGDNFIPPSLANSTTSRGFNSTTSFIDWLSEFLPNFSAPLLREVETLYPPIGHAEDISYNTTYERAGLIYRDVVLACPSYWVARTARNEGWVGEYTISPAKHGSDTIYVAQLLPSPNNSLSSIARNVLTNSFISGIK